ncbi:UDP-N-acetylmuramoyl-tripeptide--D-alanyl-D-alanine ligase [Nesterenkonia sp. E16_7]|uniref:UDP-N-acetylmuramoyl-tripeptide--D-alanyl-D- alanine ligase n=1 Tax=unclassified Nesterenkonia TaxID=2629769 RepID=UPI001A91D110|nr:MULTISPECIES: UDP-N-acetylmuramoyl-tripeptide--D-alanyl-D-alanine ligase [unclassified Nesterenkonia]MBO0595103.1 UDP-N-acetylmuramoyl-tripeptide--D-alanyl-D-alanine ligase [Nesterenkonia sp. E16_10]MBO0598758.1 UDP-N-acetylmuramoyl-tripeptide--D-alanyl-D-alanine ligase [Nesterenkonia sp. E16_7]
MIELSAAEIAEITAGTLHGVPNPSDLRVRHADTDSRSMAADSMFIAKPGETTDGHHFIDAALAAGATLVLAQRATQAPDGAAHPSVVVPDVVSAMGQIAAAILDRVRAHSVTTVIGITGSAGKTTTKDLLKSILEPEGPTVAPQGSYNGEVGVPLTIFTAELQTRFLVVEMGADAPGNIRDLAQMVRPDIGAVLMVGSAHAGKFGGADKIAAVKAELVEEIGAAGTVVLNRDDPQVASMAPSATAPITWFSETTGQASENETAPGAGLDQAVPDQVRALDLSLDEAGHPRFQLRFTESGEEFPVVSGLTGAHHVSNLLAAAACALRAGVAPAAIAQRLNGLGPASRWRMERTERADGVTLINDAYNANPESMREALRTLAMLTRPGQGRPARRSVAVLGAMLELGEVSIPKHTQLGETVVRLNIDKTLVVGDLAYPLYRGAIAEGSWGSEVHWVATVEEAEAYLDQELAPGDIVLFKSSNSAGLRLLGDKIAAKEGAL